MGGLKPTESHMMPIRLTLILLAAGAVGCSSEPPREALPETAETAVDPAYRNAGEGFVALPEEQPEAGDETTAYSNADDPAVERSAVTSIEAMSPRQQYQSIAARPEAESRALQFSLGSQTFNYMEDGELVVSGPIASGKPSSPTPTGNFRILSKDKDKESSKYDNEVGTPAWMPYSMQFHGNYFLHEGYLPGHAASHGCIRLGHDHARLLFKRMKVGDQVVVSK